MNKRTKQRLSILALTGATLGAAYLYFVTGIIGSSDLPENVAIKVYSDSLLKKIPVSLDVSPDNTLYIAETGRFHQGVGDNRSQAFWLEDDLASQHIDDRLAYIHKWISKGKLTKDWFFDVSDSITVVEDIDGDGVGDKAHNFDELTGYLTGVTSGILVDGDDIYVTSIPDLWRYTDADKDFKAEEKVSLSKGYGLRASFLGHDLHGLTWGPDGKLYFSIGDRGYNLLTQEGEQLTPNIDAGRGAVFRINKDGSGLEVFASGLRNPQELAFDNYGNLFTGDNNSDGGDSARIVYVAEGGDSGWMSPYQYQTGDYLRGAWTAEKLWYLQHEDQPAWILPPIAHLGAGPSGFAHYPGLGFSERYQNHFFMADYGFSPASSKLWSFEVKNKGAGFEVEDTHIFANRKLFIDQNFGWDGKLYAVAASVWVEDTKILTIEDKKNIQNPIIAENQKLMQAGLDSLSSEKLVSLLSNPDQRMRLQAQFNLAEREEVQAFALVFADKQQSTLARIHALWGLSQIANTGTQKHLAKSLVITALNWKDLSFLENEDDELKAQVLKFLGEAGLERLADDLIPYLADNNKRIAYFAALATGKLKNKNAEAALLEQLKANNNQDVFLRHALTLALSQSLTEQTLVAQAQNKSAVVRLGVLLALRQHKSASLEIFLSDPEPKLVLEAARAIHDLSIPEAMPALAKLSKGQLPLPSKAESKPSDFSKLAKAFSVGLNSPPVFLEYYEIIIKNDFSEILDKCYQVASIFESSIGQTVYALHRRVINANLYLGDAASAERLGDYILRDDIPARMKTLAIDTLKGFTQPAKLDAVLGRYQDHGQRATELVYPTLDKLIPKLIQDDAFAQQAMAIALHYQRMPFNAEELFQFVENENANDTLRLLSFKALSSLVTEIPKGDKAGSQQRLLNKAIGIASSSSIPELAAEALVARFELQSLELLKDSKSIFETASYQEQQTLVTLLGKALDNEPNANAQALAEKNLLSLLNDFENENLKAEIQLELIEVAEQSSNQNIQNAFNKLQAKRLAESKLKQLAITNFGGNSDNGKQVFESKGDCIRCHQVKGLGGKVGPDLSEIAEDQNAEYLLAALVEPQKDIAAGYGVITITKKSGESVTGVYESDNAQQVLIKIDSGHGDSSTMAIDKKDIQSQTDLISGMPPMGLVLPARDLRDVMAYINTLK